jgi:Bacteriocin-protection, YdeI or OmpD-Associated/Domain of unknown function (DUF1905)
MGLYSIQKMTGGYMHCIALDEKIAKRLTAGNNKRVVCIINKTITLHAAIMRTKEGMHYIMIASKYLKQLKIKTGSTVDAVIKKDESELQFHIPEEFTEVFATDPEAEEIFNQLTDGNKRGLIALVNMVKSGDKKIERALKIAERLKQGITAPQKMMK